jgi:hypothetical protein
MQEDPPHTAAEITSYIKTRKTEQVGTAVRLPEREGGGGWPADSLVGWLGGWLGLSQCQSV